MRRNSKHVIAYILLLALVACVGCAPKTSKLRVSEVTHSVFYAPMYAAMELGYFKEANIDIELTNAGGADKAMTALLAKQAEIAFCGPEAAVYVVKEGREDPPVVIGQLTNKDGSFLLGRAPDPDFQWSDLAGKSIIGGRKGGMPCMSLEQTLRENGLTPGEDVEVMTHVQFNLMGGAFAGGEGDYVTMFDPAATEMENNAQGYIVASLGEAAGNVPYTCYMALKSDVTKKAPQLKAFLAAIARGQAWVLANTDAEVAKVIAPQFPDSDAALLETVVGRYRSIQAWNATPAMNPEGYARMVEIMQNAGELDDPPAYEALFDGSLLP